MGSGVVSGKKAAAKNMARDPDFYRKIGALGGAAGRTGGYASTEVDANGMTGRDRAVIAGAIGGRISRRGKAKAN